MLASLTGQRMLFNYFRIGGVNGDLNHEFMSRLGDWMSRADRADRGRPRRCSTRTRSSSAGCAASARSTRETALRMCMTGPNLRATGVPVRRPPGAPVQRLPRARLRHPDPQRGRLPRPLPAPDGRDQAEPADHRPVPPPDARRPGHGQAAAPAAAAPGPGLRRHRGPARPVRRLRRSATARTSRSGCGSTTRRSSTSRRSALLTPGHLIADTMAVMASLDPIMGGVDK